MSIKDDKIEARQQAKRARQFMFETFDPTGFEALSRHILSLIGSDGQEHIVSAYYPIGTEIDCRLALMDLAKAGHKLCLPVIDSEHDTLLFRHYAPGDDLVIGKMDTREPHPSSPLIDPDILLVPLLAFDERGARLGYGGGYYDKTIEYLRGRRDVKCIGIGYQQQLVKVVPTESHDQLLDFIITEAGVHTVAPIK